MDSQVGFRIDCEGTWMGEDRATKWASYTFQPADGIIGDGSVERWMQHLDKFRARENETRELGTICDRLPLDTVQSHTKSCS